MESRGPRPGLGRRALQPDRCWLRRSAATSTHAMSIQAAVVNNPVSQMSRGGGKMPFTEVAEVTKAGERRPPGPQRAELEPS